MLLYVIICVCEYIYIYIIYIYIYINNIQYNILNYTLNVYFIRETIGKLTYYKL